jgi:glutathione-regulated potassium-efflux system protein KefB
MELAGVSMALGAFMIGVLLSTSPYADQVKAAAGPTREVLLAVFFIAIGMAIDLQELAAMRSQLVVYLPLLLVIKFAVLAGLALAFRLGARAAFLAGMLMMPFDEIGYVILASAHSHGILSASGYALGLAMISFSFIVSPPLINVGYRLADRMRREPQDLDTRSAVTADQVVVAGYGYVGQAICAMLDRARIPYTAFEVDPEHLARSWRAGRDVHYGDLGDPHLLSAIDIRRARLVIVTTMRHDLATRMIGAMRQFYPQVPIMTAVQFLAERDALRRIGAEHVVALVPEGVLAFGRAVLDRLGVAADRTDSIASALRSRDYAELRATPETDTTARSAPDGADARFASTVAPKSVWDRLRGALGGRGRSVAPP